MFHTLKNQIRYILTHCSNGLLPYRCLLCKSATNLPQHICESCFVQLPFLENSCKLCADTLPTTQDNLICGHCLQNPPPYDRLHALFHYQPPISHLVLNLKFQKAIVNAEWFGQLLAQRIREKWYHDKPLPSMIIPIPLHNKRLQERGFNQAVEIARPIASTLNLPIDNQRCSRIKHTAAQATLSATKRKHNLRQAFAVTRSIPCSHVAVVDDIFTTGQTIRAFCECLKNQGVKTIDVWCVARAQCR